MERVLGFRGLLLALTSLVAWVIRPAGVVTHYRVGLLLLLAYAIASLVLLVKLQMGGEPGRTS